MERNRKSADIAAKVANFLRILTMVGTILCVVGAVASFAMSGLIAQYYADADNLAQAQSSITANMGVFSIIDFQAMAEAGKYGMLFGIQLLCAGVVAAAYWFLFATLRRVMTNIRDTGRAFSGADAAVFKRNFIIITVMLFLFNGFTAAAIAGILLCGVYNTSIAALSIIDKNKKA